MMQWLLQSIYINSTPFPPFHFPGFTPFSFCHQSYFSCHTLCHLFLSFSLTPPLSITGAGCACVPLIRSYKETCSAFGHADLYLDYAMPSKYIPLGSLTRKSRDIKCGLWSLDRHTQTLHIVAACIHTLKRELPVLGLTAAMSSFKTCLHIRIQCRVYLHH